MENFKSFGRKLAVPFLEGFTAITGPNGSGKSNIGDAVLFVLGPKSNKAIRAGKLTDLIFNGGKERKPSDFCRVSLVFANEDRTIPVDGDEVTLTRLVKISKSDKENYYSYFYVNGKPSSLTEFDTLLAHSRISADGYNIVRQGDVLRIVEMTPLERRRILDDIAGITKFDADLERAAKERAEVEQNLDRIRIILDEIGRQLTTLEKERDAALKYKSVKDELDVAKAKLATKRHAGMLSELAQVHVQIGEHGTERERLLSEVDRLKAELADAEAALTAIDKKIMDRGGEEAKELKVKIEHLRAEMVRATERANYAHQEIEDLKKDRVTVTTDLKRAEKESAKVAKEAEAAERLRAEADALLGEKAASLAAVRDGIAKGTGRAADVERDLAEMRGRHERLTLEAHEAKLEKDRLAEKAERLKVAVGELGDRIETESFEMKDVDWELKELEKGAGGASKSVEETRKDLFAAKKRESEVSRELHDLDPAIRRLQNDYARLKAEQDASAAVSRGFTRAVEGVLEARDHGRLKGICGTIAELAKVQKKHETAMEVAAGGRMQAVVTETDADAAAAIEYLKKNKLGRATFLPLSKMVPGRPAGKPLMAVRDPGAEGFAIDLITYDDKFKAAFWYVFRDTVVVKTMDTARKLMGGTRLVTLDGEIIDAGGAMTGGDLGEGHGRSKVTFGAASKESLEKIASELRGAVGHQEALSAELLEVRDRIAKLESALREGSHATEKTAERVAELKKRRAEHDERMKTTKAERAAREAELAEALQTAETITASIADFERQIAALEKRRDEMGKVLLAATSKELAKELSHLEAEVVDLREKARDRGAEAATKTQALVLLRERENELRASLVRMDEALAAHETTLTEARQTTEARENDLKVLVAMEAQASDELRALHKKRDAAFERRTHTAQQVAKAQEKADTTGDVVLSLKSRVPALEDAIRDLAAEVAAFAHVTIPAEIPETQEALRGRVRALENQLDGLGNVNMLALEEYERQSGRDRELKVEVERLNVERENLVKLVEEIVEKKKTGFFKVFHEINAHFQTVFARLSDGGKAELMLENPDAPFEGGLLMRAQPKGKKITRLEALSGGEKSLTSMAFIFAIQEFDPSPFYYLDEVDQNLDGINAELLARLVRVNSKTAQCIVVSLRKVTLKEADHVYGVTMTEAGLSEVVGEVRISEIVDEPEKAEVPPVEVQHG